MRLWAAGFALAGVAGALLPPASEPTVLLLSGDTDGYLAPCGCTAPMVGGVRRRIQAIKAYSIPGRTVMLENGGLVAGTGRQDEIKAETLAEALGKAGFHAINVGPQEARLGPGAVLSLQRLSGDKLLASGLEPSETSYLNQTVLRRPFLVLGLSDDPQSVAEPLGERARTNDAVLAEASEQARAAGLALIVLFQGGPEAARRMARDHPGIALIQYRASGDPADRPERVGETWIVSPGEQGKHLLRLEFAGGKFRAYQPIRLTPDFQDEPDTARLYRIYLERVREERLLEKLPRFPSDPFAGNARCGACHLEAEAVWKRSKHAIALHTLEAEGHDADPDCVGCHVVGLDRETGFRSRKATPQLADVGCESCHGPGARHAAEPARFPMPRVGEKSCAPCHVPQNSPGFDFASYWQKIKH